MKIITKAIGSGDTEIRNGEKMEPKVIISKKEIVYVIITSQFHGLPNTLFFTLFISNYKLEFTLRK